MPVLRQAVRLFNKMLGARDEQASVCSFPAISDLTAPLTLGRVVQPDLLVVLNANLHKVEEKYSGLQKS
jgi:hypothetical protein